MKKIKHYLAVIILCIAAFTVTETASLNYGITTVQAKVSSTTKKKAQNAYRRFLTQKKYKYFRVWDIDKDGLKELLVTDGKDKVGKYPAGANVYTYTGGKVVYAGYIGSFHSGIAYSRLTKRLYSSRGGGGSLESWYYTLTKNKKIKTVVCGAYENGVKNGKMQYTCLYNGKRITDKKWNQIVRSWARQSLTLKYYNNTQANRKKYIKM